jgi:trk system potassium uptake protein
VSKRGNARSTKAKTSKPSASTVVKPAVEAVAVVPVPEVRPVGSLGPSVLIPVYVLLIVTGYVCFHRGMATVNGNELSAQQSLFTAVNAATLTGFQQARNVNEYTTTGQLLTLLLMICGIVFSFTAGGLAVIRIAKMRYSDGRVFAWAWGSIALVIAVGGLLLLVVGSGIGPFSALFQSVSAFGNCGLYVGSKPDAVSVASHLFLLPLALLGGLGLPVLMELIDRVRGRTTLSDHTTTVLNWTAGCYIAAVIVLLLVQWPGFDASNSQWQQSLVRASREAINARSLGFPFESSILSAVPQTMQWIVMILMVIGAAPGGTGGGIKVTTLGVLTGGVRNSLNRRPVGRPFAIAAIWVGIYLLMLLIALLALVFTEPQLPGDRLLFLAISALGNVGLSHDPVAVSDYGLYVLSATMMAGRIAPILVLWWMAETTPEASVAVG